MSLSSILRAARRAPTHDRFVDGILYARTGDYRAAEQAPEDKTQLGMHAERLLNDPVLSLAFERVGEKLADTWRGSIAADAEGRERCHAEYRALQRVRGELMAYLGDKKVIEADMKRQQAERERKAQVG